MNWDFDAFFSLNCDECELNFVGILVVILIHRCFWDDGVFLGYTNILVIKSSQTQLSHLRWMIVEKFIGIDILFAFIEEEVQLLLLF